MHDQQFPAEEFEAHRTHLRAVAYRILGSLTEADDAVQEAWLRLARADTTDIGNLGGWLTTVVGRVCLDMLRTRKSRHEEPLEAAHLPDPVVYGETIPDPDLPQRRRVVDAFLTAARGGDFGELLRLLDPDVVLRADAGETMRVIRGATAVAGQAETFQHMATRCTVHPAVVNGHAGLVNTIDGNPFSIIEFAVAGERITAIDILSDPDRLARLDLTAILG